MKWLFVCLIFKSNHLLVPHTNFTDGFPQADQIQFSFESCFLYLHSIVAKIQSFGYVGMDRIGKSGIEMSRLSEHYG